MGRIKEEMGRNTKGDWKEYGEDGQEQGQKMSKNKVDMSMNKVDMGRNKEKMWAGIRRRRGGMLLH